MDTSENASFGDGFPVTDSLSGMSSALDTEPTCPAGSFTLAEQISPDVVARLVFVSDPVRFCYVLRIRGAALLTFVCNAAKNDGFKN